MKYYLHYVGGKLYPKEVFIKEAERIGVNRCIPMKMIKNLKWGDKILLGTFNPGEQKKNCDYCKKCGETICGNDTEYLSCFEGKLDGRKNRSGGRAEIFGYFIITGLNLNASDEFKKALAGRLEIVETKNNNTRIQRQCGSYILGNSYVVKDSISDIIKKAEQLKIERKEETAKFFISGLFRNLSLVIEPINFTRTLIPVELETELALEDLNFLKEVGLIYDYNKRAYIKKYAKRGRPKKEKK